MRILFLETTISNLHDLEDIENHNDSVNFESANEVDEIPAKAETEYIKEQYVNVIS